MPRLHAPETRWFDDFAIGETFYIPSRTMTGALFAAFQLASGDNDPIHYDIEFCKERGHPAMLAHGLQVFIQTAAGRVIFPSKQPIALLRFYLFPAKCITRSMLVIPPIRGWKSSN